MSERLSEEDKKNIAVVISWINQQISKKISAEETISEMVNKGFSYNAAADLYNEVIKLRAAGNIPKKSKRQLKKEQTAQKGISNMTKGCLVLVVGLGITGGTYLFAEPNGSFVICYGAIIFGALWFVIGLLQWLFKGSF